MKKSLPILGFFLAGVALAYAGWVPRAAIENDLSVYILYGLMFLVGIKIGYSKEVFKMLKIHRFRLLLVPLATLAGTLAGCAAVGLLMPQRSITEWLAVGSGFGYYSLSSILITQCKGAELGTIALASNILRELFTLVAAPFLATYFGRLAPIAAGGATSMDTTLPVITRYSGADFAIVAIIHGMALDLTVPFLVTFFCHL